MTNPIHHRSDIGLLVQNKLRSVFSEHFRCLFVESKKIGDNFWQCAICEKVLDLAHLNVDHQEPVIATTGFVSWDEFISRLFNSPLQILCKMCHAKKSAEENADRKSPHIPARAVGVPISDPDEIKEIHRLRSIGLTFSNLARQFHTTPQVIAEVCQSRKCPCSCHVSCPKDPQCCLCSEARDEG
jgi:hypothetical protein